MRKVNQFGVKDSGRQGSCIFTALLSSCAPCTCLVPHKFAVTEAITSAHHLGLTSLAPGSHLGHCAAGFRRKVQAFRSRGIISLKHLAS